ncbi:MAG TPA: hypothetical protein VIL74_02335 [Pyrinomonadaceae bacterium]
MKNTCIVRFASVVMTALFSLSASGQSGAVQSTDFGMHRIASGQTAAVSVVNRRPLNETEIIPCVRVLVVADVYETNFSEFVKPRFLQRVVREERLEAGEALFFNFTPSRASDASVSISVFFFRERETETPDSARRAVSSTLQVTENGRSIYTLPGVVKTFDPQPDPPAGK